MNFYDSNITDQKQSRTLSFFGNDKLICIQMRLIFIVKVLYSVISDTQFVMILFCFSMHVGWD